MDDLGVPGGFEGQNRMGVYILCVISLLFNSHCREGGRWWRRIWGDGFRPIARDM